jgi:hypothetical protein
LLRGTLTPQQFSGRDSNLDKTAKYPFLIILAKPSFLSYSK